jgi:signal transduction histidine kinase
MDEEKPGDPKHRSPERTETDESLRREREKVDDAIGVTFGVLEQLADAVIEKARGRADAVLAAARAKADRKSARTGSQSAGMLARLRAREDAVLQRERSEADGVVRVERASQNDHLSTLRYHTDTNLLEERARADDAVATRDDFLGIVSHDLRNMLGSVLGFATLIEKADLQKHPDMARQNAQRIKRSVARMSRLLEDLVDVASIEAETLALRSEVGDPAALVLEAVDTFQAQARRDHPHRRSELAAARPIRPSPDLSGVDEPAEQRDQVHLAEGSRHRACRADRRRAAVRSP